MGEGNFQSATQLALLGEQVRSTPRQSFSAEPIAIVGVGCRFPGGANSAAEFWQLLRSGRDAIAEVPADRWNIDEVYDADPETPGKTYSRWGGFLDDYARFDAAFFGVSPREAAQMDPRQRILLETAWQALEHAAIVPQSLARSNAGVFIGNMVGDSYSVQAANPRRIGAYSSTGNLDSIFANRISYLLNLQGPSMAVDTACSSALVALYLACQSLRQSECDVALTGGINLMLTPEMHVMGAKSRLLSPGGRSKTFDADADGFVRGEGCGMLVLKRLADALHAGDRIVAVIRGIAINQDGRSNGISAPNGLSQERVIRSALANAMLEPSQVTFVETHGTGTLVGDTIECEALARVYGSASPAGACHLGAVKTNIGHLEAAAGAAGIIKMALSLEQQHIPRNLHLHRLNPHIVLHATRFQLPDSGIPWVSQGGTRFGAVSSFGLGGTNGHVILEQAPTRPGWDAPVEGRLQLVTLSAKDQIGLEALVGRYQRFLAHKPEADLAGIAYTANTGRTHFAHRASIVADSIAALQEGLRRLRIHAFETRPPLRLGFVQTDGTGESCRQELIALWKSWGIHPAVVVDEMGLDTAVARGCNVVLEIGASSPTFREAATKAGVLCLGSSDPLKDERRVLLESFATLYEMGANIDWTAFEQLSPSRKVDLPTYPFAGEHYWVRQVTRPWAGTIARSPLVKETIVTTTVNLAAMPYLRDHRVAGQVMVPGACYLTMLRMTAESLGSASCRLHDVVFEAPLRWETPCTMQAVLTPEPPGNALRFQVVSVGSEMTRHASGRLSLGGSSASRSVDLAQIRARCMIAKNPADVAPAGIEYGESFRWIHAVWVGDGEALAELRLPGNIAAAEVEEWDHPGLLDACFQIADATLPDGGRREVLLPFSLRSLDFHGNPTGTAWFCRAVSKGELIWDLELFDPEGRLLARIRDFEMRGVAGEVQPREEISRWMYEIAWRLQPTGPKGIGPASFHIAGGSQIEREELGSGLRSLGHRIASDEVCDHIVFLADCPAAGEDVACAAGRNITAALPIVQSAIYRTVPARLWFITRRSQAVEPGDGVTPEHAPLWGLARTLRLEHPELRCTCVDLDGPKEILLGELPGAGDETQIAYRSGNRYVARLIHHRHTGRPDGQPMRLQLAEYGSPDHLQFAAAQRRQPGPGEVEIEVRAASLNFRDVLIALGMMKEIYERSFGIANAKDLPLGLDCAGTIAAVGEGVTDLRPGDRVMAAATGSFASFVTLHRELVVHQPRGLSFAAASAIPSVFFTAYYALKALAKLQRGERVLIHAAAGGVGQAAIQIAQAAGAEIFATASLAKWEFLKSQGIRHVMNSRGLDFADRTLEATHGEGVDVVLNSLNGAAIEKSLAVVKLGGRFVEIGKLGSWTSAQVAAVRPDVIYSSFDLGELTRSERPLVCRTLEAIRADFDAGRLHALPQSVFPVERAAEAYRFVQQARHTGKVVLSFASESSPAIRKDASYLITGGLGGLGLRVAQDFADQGARHLILTSRGVPNRKAREAILRLEEAGVTVLAVPSDVADPVQCARLLSSAQPPLRGIVHAAGVLDDGIVERQTAERFARVLAPKVAGAWNLHQFTEAIPLDFFVCFSSVASVMGAAGQGNYAAANAFLDALAHYRRSMGLCALTVNWGPWSGAGMARDGESRLTSRGERMIDPGLGTRLLRHAMQQNTPQLGVFNFDWERFAEDYPTREFLSEITSVSSRTTEAASSVLRQLLDTPSQGRRSALEEFVRLEVARVLGHPPSAVPRTCGFADLGMDSLASIELRARLQQSLGSQLPGTVAFDYPTVEALSCYLAGGPLAHVFAVMDAPGSELDHLAPGEIAALLAAELNSLEGQPS